MVICSHIFKIIKVWKKIKVDDLSYIKKEELKLYSTILQLLVSSCILMFATLIFIVYMILKYFGNSTFLLRLNDIFIF